MSSSADSMRQLDEELARNRVKTRLLGVGSKPVRLGRFEVLRVLGRGGMGTVYEAHDPQLDRPVALKTLQRVDPVGVDRFKREFRSLANLTHPGLVRFHSLFSEAGLWFFSMDRVQGLPLTEAVRDCDGELDVAMLRSCLAQVGDALSALHNAGKLHRDIKPPNVLVSELGQVTILDFGVVRDHESNYGESLEAGAVGTPGYTAPELILERPAEEHADFYAVGVMLFEALTGQRPFGTGVGELLARTQHNPPAPSSLAAGVPGDLDALCVGLLARDPRLRAGAPELMALAGAEAPRKARRRRRSAPFPAPPSPFVGRQQELQALQQAFADTVRGRAACVLLTGAEQSGKAALAHYFASRCPEDTVVLRGRACSAEHLPCEIFDGITDSLGAYLRRCHHEVVTLLPRHIHDLVKLFPVLGRVPEVAEAPVPLTASGCRSQSRTRAVQALQEILQRLGDRRPVVLLAEGLQWAEADSASLLHGLISEPDPAPVLFVGTCRSEDMASSPFIRKLRELCGADAELLRVIELAPHTPH